MENEKMIQKKILLAGLLMIFAYGLVNNTLGFFTVPVTESLGCSRSSFHLYYSVSCLVSLAASPFIGRKLQHCNARNLIGAGTGIGTLAFLGFSLCRNVRLFYAAAVFLGLIQQGSTSVTAMVLVQRAYKKGAGAVTGVIMSGTGICSIAMSYVLPNLMEAMGWSAGYVLEAVLWFLTMGAAWCLTANTVELPPEQSNGQKKYTGGKKTDWKGAMPQTILLFICFAVHGMCTIMVQHMPPLLTELGRTGIEASTIMAVFSSVLIAGKMMLGWLYDRLGAIFSIVFDYVAFSVGMWVVMQHNDLLLYAGIVLIGIGMASITVLFPLITERVFGKALYPLFWGIMSMAISCGTAIGSPVWGAVHDHYATYFPALRVAALVVLANAAVVTFVVAHYGTTKHGSVS